MRVAAIFLVLSCLVVAGEPSSVNPLKLQTPGKEVTDRELAKIAQVFSEELKSAKVDVKFLLCDKLIQLSQEEKNKDTKYAMLIKSREIALDTLASNLACSATYSITDEFDVNKLKEFIPLLQTLIKKVNGLNEQHPTIQQYGKDLVLEQHRENIVTLIEYSSHLALNQQKLEELRYLPTAFQWLSSNQWDTPKLKVRTNRVKLAIEMLTPGNVNSSLYNLLVNNQWKTELTKVTENSPVSVVVSQELKAKTGEDKLAVVESWIQWSSSQKIFKSKEQVDRTIGIHCMELLHEAKPDLSGLSKAKAEKVFASLDQKFPSVKEVPVNSSAPGPVNSDTVTVTAENLLHKPFENYSLASRTYSETYDGMVKQWQLAEPAIRNSCVITTVRADGSTSTSFDQVKYDQSATDFRDAGNKTLIPLKVKMENSRLELQKMKTEFLSIFKQRSLQNADEQSQSNLKRASELLLQYPDR